MYSFVFFVAISLSKVHSELLHTDSRGIASSFNDTGIHVLSCDGYQGQLLKKYLIVFYVYILYLIQVHVLHVQVLEKLINLCS